MTKTSNHRRISDRGVLALLVLAPSCTSAPTASASASTAEGWSAAGWLEAHRDEPTLLRAFLQRMPKGGDIHNHLSGSVYAESFLEWAAEDGFYLVENGLNVELVRAPDPTTIAEKQLVSVATALTQPTLYGHLIDQLSTRNLEFARRSGHDQFFAVFGEFGPVSGLRTDDMVAEVAERAASEGTQYLELMLTLQSSAVKALAQGLDLDGGLAAAREELFRRGLGDLVRAGSADLDLLESELESLLGCGSPNPSPGCDVVVRYLQQTTRVLPPEIVFAQFTYAVELARADERVVGLNLVAPEDNRVALRDYRLHMEMLDYLVGVVPDTNVALHAGELTLGLVPPADLRFHIADAVRVGRARRIGHGVDVSYEDGALELLEEMRARDVLVEICLTSNDVILGVEGDRHPLPMYLEAGVPVTLATDDAGVSRIDLTNEYLRATLTYGLDYETLKAFARNSLEHSFLPGPSLWRPGTFEVVDPCAGVPPGSPDPPPDCAAFLNASERARVQWRHEAALAEFETLGWLE